MARGAKTAELLRLHPGSVLARSASNFVMLLALSATLTSCGYRPVYGGTPPARLSVVAARPKVPQAPVIQEVLAGVRSELSRAGALKSGDGYPQLVVEVLRVDARSAGIRRAPLEPAVVTNGELPLARGEAVSVVGRAWVLEAPHQAPQSDTGDVRRSEVIAAQQTAARDGFARDQALGAAARELGTALARSVLGEPIALDE